MNLLGYNKTNGGYLMNDKTKIIKIIVAVAICLVSIFGLSRLASSPNTFKGTISSLDDKKTTVLELTAAATAASAVASAIPGDTATPIAEKLADLSSYFLMALCAIYLEKYLLTITGAIAFYFLIPAGCILFIASEFMYKERFMYYAKKLLALSFVIVLLIPCSVKLSDMIQSTYETSIQETIDTANNLEAVEEQESEDSNVIDNLINDLSNSWDTLTSQVETILSRFIESLAIMLVTCCLIPVLVLIFFLWLIKLLFTPGLEK